MRDTRIKVNDLIKRKGSSVSWIVDYVYPEGDIVVVKNEGRPMSRIIKKENLNKYWKKVKEEG